MFCESSTIHPGYPATRLRVESYHLSKNLNINQPWPNESTPYMSVDPHPPSGPKRKCGAEAVAQTDCVVYRLRRSTMDTLEREDPAAAVLLQKVLLRDLSQLMAQFLCPLQVGLLDVGVGDGGKLIDFLIWMWLDIWVKCY